MEIGKLGCVLITVMVLAWLAVGAMILGMLEPWMTLTLLLAVAGLVGVILLVKVLVDRLGGGGTSYNVTTTFNGPFTQNILIGNPRDLLGGGEGGPALPRIEELPLIGRRRDY